MMVEEEEVAISIFFTPVSELIIQLRELKVCAGLGREGMCAGTSPAVFLQAISPYRLRNGYCQ